jgi:hypothetical protein
MTGTHSILVFQDSDGALHNSNDSWDHRESVGRYEEIILFNSSIDGLIIKKPVSTLLVLPFISQLGWLE